MEEIRSALLEILEGLHPDEDFETATDLVDAKVIKFAPNPKCKHGIWKSVGYSFVNPKLLNYICIL